MTDQNHGVGTAGKMAVRCGRSGPSRTVQNGFGMLTPLILVLALFLAACGEDGNEPTATGPATENSEASGPSATEAPPITDEPPVTEGPVDTEAPPESDAPPPTDEPVTSEAPPLADPPPACTDYTAQEELPLDLCSEGDLVASAQNDLVMWGYGIDADGLFGPATEEAVRDFQDLQGLETDGIIDEATWNALSRDGRTEQRPSLITIDGQEQNIIGDCVHYPFQNRDGVQDAHVGADLYLVDDPSSGARRVVEVWVQDGTRLLALVHLSEASVRVVEIPFEFDEPVTATLSAVGGDVTVVIDVRRPELPCPTMYLESQAGSFVAYGVIDVCQSDGVTVATFNSWWGTETFRQAYSEMNYRLDDDLASGQLRLADDDVDATFASSPLAGGETVSGTFPRDGENWSFEVDIASNGAHDCVWGQIAD